VKDRNRPKIKRVQNWLLHILQEGLLPAIERTAAGNSLASIGDPRFREDAWYLPNDPRLGFLEIPAGPFLMGSDKKMDRDANDSEVPQHMVTLPKYYIARYPVTVAQFRVFVEGIGYTPHYWDCLKGLHNHPVVDVTWYDALAYCDWLTERLKAWKDTPQPLKSLLKKGEGGGHPWRITLPSEAEWEKAARGGDGRIYPWGDKPDPNLANCRDTGIRTTSTVGCFIGGKSPYKCLDISGNVLEWTRSLYKEYPYNPVDGREDLKAGKDRLRVLRGGAFDHDHWEARCANRSRHRPDYRGENYGFRVVIFPIFFDVSFADMDRASEIIEGFMKR
jgi:formylglycine-generating enzyme required for sulfatase activity